jgi:amidohydrolase
MPAFAEEFFPCAMNPRKEMDFRAEASRLAAELVAWRRDFHAHPELGYAEHRTAGIVSEELKRLGYAVQSGVAETGVIGLLQAPRRGPVVLLRFDMDALPIQEETGAPYASCTPGVMHACGHDGHTAIGLGVARILAKQMPTTAGSVKLIFQPAEEGLRGAERMVEEGALRDPKPDFALALHLWNGSPRGSVALTKGPIMAAAEILSLDITGQGGHGALPHQTVDPVVAAAQIITALQTVVSRNVDALQAAVVSITQVESGETFNVIPASARLRGTIRTLAPETRTTVMRRVEEVAQGVASAMQCEAAIKIEPLAPAVLNDPEVTGVLQEVVRKQFPALTLHEELRIMSSEDMAFFMQGVRGCYTLVGSSNPGKGLDAPHHNPRFDFDEDALVDGTALLAAFADRLLRME